jgi:hypothetical protein
MADVILGLSHESLRAYLSLFHSFYDIVLLRQFKFMLLQALFHQSFKLGILFFKDSTRIQFLFVLTIYLLFTLILLITFLGLRMLLFLLVKLCLKSLHFLLKIFDFLLNCSNIVFLASYILLQILFFDSYRFKLRLRHK